MILYCNVISYVNKKVTASQMENEPRVGKIVLLTFSGRTVLSSKCDCSRVLLPST